LFALNLVSEQFARSVQPLVPERLFISPGGHNGDGKLEVGSVNVASQLLSLLLAEKAGINVSENSPELAELEKFAAELTRKTAGNKAATTVGAERNGGRR
jgi:hypothetical protein